MFEYEQQRRPQKHEGGSRLITPPPAKRAIQTHRNDQVRFYIPDKNERYRIGLMIEKERSYCIFIIFSFT